MNFLTDVCLPALLVASAALVSLRLMGETSHRFRAALAVTGLLAWFAPWSLLTLRVSALPNLPLTQWIDTTAGLLAVSVYAQQRSDPRIGEWREDYYSNSVGLYMIYEDLGNGMIRVHTAENLARQNRLHQDVRCDGEFYPIVDAEGKPAGISTSCTVVDDHTVATKMIRETAQGREEGEGTWTLSSDGNHFTTVAVWKDPGGNERPPNVRRFTRNSENCLNHAEDELFRECQRRSRPLGR